jgi:tRNA dimethylallyltransferase
MATKYLVCVLGPTASGKTSLSIQIAQHFNTHILSADSRQLYKGLNIGTAKATPEEQAQAPHHFIDTLEITQEYNAGQFERDALALLNELYQTHDVVVLAGGTGLYVQALLQGLDEFPAIPNEVRQQVRDDFDTKGIAWLQQEVLRLDPEFYAIVDQQNPSRLTRALEVCRASGKPYSSFRSGKAKQRSFNPILIGLEWPKEALYDRIDARVDMMLEQGLLEEAHQFLPHKNQQALQTVGYEELMRHFAGEYDLPEAIRLIKRNSRHYAKRQMTWLNRMEGITWFKTAEVGEVIPFIEKQVG